jgi:hypothetical protein
MFEKNKPLAKLNITEIWGLINNLSAQIDKAHSNINLEICVGGFSHHDALIYIVFDKIKKVQNSGIWCELDHIENETIVIRFVPGRVLVSAVHDISKVILSRLISIFPVISILSADELNLLLGKEIRLSLGDRGADDALCFSGCGDFRHLIPDAYFFLTHGYLDFRDEVTTSWTNWLDRHDSFYWRGATTGVGFDGSLLSAQRTRFVRYVNSQLTNKLFNVKFSRLNCSSSLSDFLISHNCVANEDPPITMIHYRYNIDVDGNTNSWPGFFQKLLSGSPVLKITSEHSYMQWYYTRLVPWVHYVPVKEDLSDFLAVSEELRRDPELSNKIGSAGRDLALSMTYESECEFFLNRLLDI